MLHHLYRKIKLWLKKDKRAAWPRSLFELEQAVYPYFLQAFELPPEEYEKARDLLDQCVEDAFNRMKGKGPKVEMTSRSEE